MASNFRWQLIKQQIHFHISNSWALRCSTRLYQNQSLNTFHFRLKLEFYLLYGNDLDCIKMETIENVYFVWSAKSVFYWNSRRFGLWCTQILGDTIEIPLESYSKWTENSIRLGVSDDEFVKPTQMRFTDVRQYELVYVLRATVTTHDTRIQAHSTHTKYIRPQSRFL